MKQYRNFSFIGATQGLRTHQPEANLPTARKIENFYVSRSDGALTLRPDLWRFRDDIWAIGNLLQDSNEYYSLNTIITSDSAERNAFLTTHGPTGIGQEITANYYDAGTVTTDGTESVVTGTGTLWKDLIWPGCLIEFDGSSSLYLVTGVTSDTILTTSLAPPVLSNVTYKIYRVNDATRGRYPFHVERFNNQYIYCASSPVAGNSETISGPFTSDGEFINGTTSTTTSTARTSIVRAVVSGISVPKFIKVEYLNGQWVGITYAEGAVYSSADRKTWTRKSYLPVFYGQSSSTIAYGAGYYAFASFAIVGNVIEGRVYLSTDLGSWTYETLPLASAAPAYPSSWGLGATAVVTNVSVVQGGQTTISPRDIIFAGSKFVVVGKVDVRCSVIITYHYSDAPYSHPQGTFYATRNLSYTRPLVWTSTDGTTWTVVDIGSSFDGEEFKTISYANSKYICTMAGGIAHSTNTTSWTEVACPSGISSFSGISFAGAIYVAVGIGTNSKAAISTTADLSSWTSRTVPAETLVTSYEGYNDITHDGTNFVAVTGRTVDSSANGITWTNRIDATATAANFRTIANNTNYLLVSGLYKTYYSDNATAWTDASTNTVTFKAIASTNNANLATIRGEISAPDTIVAVGETTLGYVYTSTNGDTFAPVALADQEHRNDVIWNGSIFVVVGDAGKIDTSPDGLHWTAQTSGSTANLYAVTYSSADTLFVAVGAVDTGDAVILSSPDAVTWTLRTSGLATDDLLSVACNATTYFAVGENGSLVSSSDGATWVVEMPISDPSDGLVTVNKIIWDGTYYWVVGNSGLIARSTTGAYSPAHTIEAGDDSGALHSWVINGSTTANTDAGILYWNYTYTLISDTRLVEVYSDSAKTALVASGSLVGAGTITLAEQGGSGIWGLSS